MITIKIRNASPSVELAFCEKLVPLFLELKNSGRIVATRANFDYEKE